MNKFFTGWSKKLTAFLVYVGVLLLNKRFELGLSEADIYAMTVGVAGYSIGQGLADWGKSKALIENGAKPKPTP